MLPSPSIRKFLRETFSGLEPVRIEKTPDQIEWLKPVQKQLDALIRVECKFHVIHRLKLSEQTSQLDITVSPNESGRRWGDSERFKLYFSDETGREGLLLMSDDGWRRRDVGEGIVSNVEEVEKLVGLVKGRQDRNALRERKSEKLSTLKESGMKARLRELGNEMDFSFAIGQNARNVNLSLRVAGKKTGYHFSFPKGKFDSMLEQLPELISNFENMANLGIAFRTNNRKWQQSEWIFPDDDDDYED